MEEVGGAQRSSEAVFVGQNPKRLRGNLARHEDICL
jgi:hypothetical protein